jgi:hypothetical protein
MNLKEIYAEYVANWISSGSLILRTKLSSLGIKSAFDRYLTKKYVTKVWAVTNIPVNFDHNLTYLIRDKMFVKCPEVKTIIHMYCVPTKIAVSNDTFVRQMASAEEKYKAYDEMFRQLSDTDQKTGRKFRTGSGSSFTIRKKDLDRMKELYESYAYVYTHRMEGMDRGDAGEFFNVHLFIQASAENRESLSKYQSYLSTILHANKVSFTDLKGKISQYLTNFGPASYAQGDLKGFPKMLMSDENIAAISSVKSRGLVGGEGVLFGIDWLSKLPFWVNLFASSAAQVVMVLAKSGVGKTALVQMISLSLLSRTHHVSVTDLKGNEWNRLFPFIGNKLEISMHSSKERFVNVLRIDDMNADESNCEDIYNLAVDAGIELFSIPVNLQENEGNIVDLHMILRTAIKKTFSQLKDFDEKIPHTFSVTKHITYSSVLDNVHSLENTASYTEGQRKMIPEIVSRCREVFGDATGSDSDFKDEVTLNEVINTPLVVYSFNKNRSTFVDVKEEMRLFMVQHLSRKKHYIRKQAQLHSIEIYEEFQRAKNVAKHKGTSKFINHISQVVTGSRSDNVTVFLLMNTLEPFQDPDTLAIQSNITTYVVGKLQKSDMEKFVDMFGADSMLPYLENICLKEDPTFTNVFAVKYDNGLDVDQAMCKAIIPSYLEEELRQRDVVDSIKTKKAI